MVRADKQIKHLQKQRQQYGKRMTAAKRKLDKAIRRRDAVRQRLERVDERRQVARDILARAVRVHPDPRGRQVVDKPLLRKESASSRNRHSS